MLVLSRKPGERILIEPSTMLTVVRYAKDGPVVLQVNDITMSLVPWAPLVIGPVTVRFTKFSPRGMKLEFDAPEAIRIFRAELLS